ncbi:MAG: glycerol-3-phosphate dehydrogenase C-terminal domain-containing protein, partial [Gammaproteobacteria bacterium]
GPFEEQVCYGYAGVRPLPFQNEGTPGSITRRHHIHAHTRAQGMFSIIGGKLTTHRSLAEDVLHRIRKRLPASRRGSDTASRRFPGMLDANERGELEAELTAVFNAELARRLLQIYGAGAADILALAGESRELAMVLGPQSQVLVAEIAFAIDSQWARSITDVLQRRCMAGLAADRGLRDAEYAARWLVRLGRVDRHAALAQLIDYRAWLRRHRPVISAR